MGRNRAKLPKSSEGQRPKVFTREHQGIEVEVHPDGTMYQVTKNRQGKRAGLRRVPDWLAKILLASEET